MIRGRLLLCAEGVVIDQRSNNASAFEILEQLNPVSLPIVFPKLVVLSVFERDEGDPDKFPANIRVTLGESEILNQEVRHDFQGKKRTRHTFSIGGLPITQPGILEVSVQWGEAQVMSYTVEVTAPTKAKVKKPYTTTGQGRSTNLRKESVKST